MRQEKNYILVYQPNIILKTCKKLYKETILVIKHLFVGKNTILNKASATQDPRPPSKTVPAFRRGGALLLLLGIQTCKRVAILLVVLFLLI